MSSDILREKNSLANPFIYNSPVRGADFFNRDVIIDRLLKETVTGKTLGNVWITGERQVGKTSLLRYIQSTYEDNNLKIQLYGGNDDYFSAAFVYLNVQDNKSREDFFNNLQQSLKSFFDFKLESREEDTKKNFLNSLEYLHFKMNYYIVFLLDEFDALIETLAAQDHEVASSLLAELNTLTEGGTAANKNGIKTFSCIFAANHTPHDLLKESIIRRIGSGLITQSIKLEWFTHSQVVQLSNHYLKDNSIQLTDEEIDFCFKMTQGYPYFVQVLLSLIYEHKANGAISKDHFKKIKKEYGEIFEETVKGWGGTYMPKPTLEKLKGLLEKIGKVVGEAMEVNYCCCSMNSMSLEKSKKTQSSAPLHIKHLSRL
ncbi:MAG TPA: AAA-like domain-containing protein [Candidatus Kapabacteria bacterium]|nr:AAA-like domain-containing protein [Candidatus Kapabacteria bacterium]